MYPATYLLTTNANKKFMMDYMDPQRRMRHGIMQAIGYVLMGIVLLLATTVLIFIAYGFGLKDGRVIQSGLIVVSSTPNPAQVYVNGVRNRGDTNTELVLPEASYNFVLKRSGYRDWSRTINLQGGTVARYNYPLLFPSSLTTATVHAYDTAPPFVSQSPDQRWLLVAHPGSLITFDLYDINSPKQAPVQLDLPTELLSLGSNEHLETIAWTSDNNSLLLKHTYSGASEYILLDRSTPNQSINLTKRFALATSSVDLRLLNGASDQYVFLKTDTQELFKVSLNTPIAQLYLPHVLAFAMDGTSTVLYVTPDNSDPSKVIMTLNDGTNNYTIRHAKVDQSYLLAMAHHGNDVFAAMSAPSEGSQFIYKNPLHQLMNQQSSAIIPSQVLSLKGVTSVAFSTSAHYILFANGMNAATYDTEADHGYTYILPGVLDGPEIAPQWMDDARLVYVSHGQTSVCDYDGQNCVSLVSADPQYTIYFDASYKTLYAFVSAASNKVNELLTSTSLRTRADQ
jgi:hypothetical protein